MYTSRPTGLRDSERRRFITTQGSFQVRWVKTVMREAGINVEQFKPHSTRACSCFVSGKVKGCTFTKYNMKAAGWAWENIFSRFYNKPVKEGSKFQTAVLQKNDVDIYLWGTCIY